LTQALQTDTDGSPFSGSVVSVVVAALDALGVCLALDVDALVPRDGGLQ
jgi:hypothetical protein